MQEILVDRHENRHGVIWVYDFVIFDYYIKAAAVLKLNDENCMLHWGEAGLKLMRAKIVFPRLNMRENGPRGDAGREIPDPLADQRRLKLKYIWEQL